MLIQTVPLERVRPELRPFAQSVHVLYQLVAINPSREVLRAAVQECQRLLDGTRLAAASDIPEKNCSTGLW